MAYRNLEPLRTRAEASEAIARLKAAGFKGLGVTAHVRCIHGVTVQRFTVSGRHPNKPGTTINFGLMPLKTTVGSKP